MKILDRKNTVQNIKNPVINILKKEEAKAEVKDSIVIGSQKEVSQQEISKLEKMKEAMIKGKDNLIAGAEKTSEYLDKSPVLSGTLDTTLQFFKTLKSFPKFIYPSLINMTGDEREMVLSVLDDLPLKQATAVKSITMVNSLPGGSGGAGPVPFSPFVLLSRDSLSGNIEWAKEVVTHEIGHTVDYDTGLYGLPKLFSESSKAPWGEPPYITSYAEKGPGWYPAEWDDFAESFAYYHRNPEELKTKCPEKFERMAEMEKNGFFQGLIDKEAFRETGKFMGSIMEKVPYLQNGLSMITFVAGLVQAYKGLGELRRSEKTGDPKLKMNAIMNFAAGSCFASKLFCIVGMGIEGAKSELNRAIEKKQITAEEANAVVQATVGVIAGPVGNAINWVWSKTPWGKKYEINKDTIEQLTGKIPEDKLAIIKSLEDRGLAKKDFERALEKLNFNDKEIDLVTENLHRPEKTSENYNLYSMGDITAENLKGKIPEKKLEFLKSLENKELTDKELKKELKKAKFDAGEIALVRAFAEVVENTGKIETGLADETGSLKRATGIAAGGAAGGLAGGFIGPYLGVLAGFAIGGPVGGAVGLIAGAILGLYAGRRAGGELGNLVGKRLEKIFDGKKTEIEEEVKENINK